MIEALRQSGGRGYALGVYAISAVFLLGMSYVVMLFVLLYKGEPLTAEHLGPFSILLVILGGLGGFTQLPNTVERWTGNYSPNGKE